MPRLTRARRLGTPGRLASLILGAVLLSAACGDPNHPTPSASVPGSTTPSGSPGSAADEWERLLYGYSYQPERGIEGGTVTVGDWHGSGELNPLLAGSSANRSLFFATMRTPFLVTADGHWKPDLATRMPSLSDGSIRPDPAGAGFDVDVELRPDLRWSDGQPATTHDLDYTWQFVRDATQLGAATTGWKAIDRITVADDTHATVHFKEPYADYLAVLASYFFPEHYFKTADRADIGRLYPFSAEISAAVTIGPFKYASIAGRDVSLVRDENWHGPAQACPGRACLDRIVYRTFPDDKAGLIKAFVDGNVDVALGLDDTDYSAIADVAASGQALLGPAWLYEHFDMNEAGAGQGKGHPALRDVIVRRAIAQAIDRQALNQAVHASALPNPTENLVACTNAMPSNYWRLPDPVCPAPDLAAANQALDGAGYKRGADGIRVDPVSGLPLVLEHCTTGDPYREVGGRFIADELAKIGIKLHLNFVSSKILFAAAREVSASTKCSLARGTFDTAEFKYALGFDLHDDYYYSYHSDQIPTEANGWSGFNFLRFNDPAVDRAIDTLGTAINPQEQIGAAYEIQRIYLREVPEIALYYRNETRGSTAALHNLVMHPGATLGTAADTWNIEDWWLGD
ncbi:MAG: peptide/nickel transport system substrate-binding protein [Chloroflexota bacterium]|nr:peptide/nickel transport system substrate-binding protein [Chloroflexota bacterium]